MDRAVLRVFLAEEHHVSNLTSGIPSVKEAPRKVVGQFPITRQYKRAPLLETNFDTPKFRRAAAVPSDRPVLPGAPGYSRPMIALASRGILEPGARLWKYCRPSPKETI